MKLRSFAHTDVGRVRPENEDSFLRNDEHQLYAVADGIGGLPSGGQASQLAVATLDKIFTSHAAGHKLNYPRIVAEVNDQVFRLGEAVDQRIGVERERERHG